MNTRIFLALCLVGCGEHTAPAPADEGLGRLWQALGLDQVSVDPDGLGSPSPGPDGLGGPVDPDRPGPEPDGLGSAPSGADSVGSGPGDVSAGGGAPTCEGACARARECFGPQVIEDMGECISECNEELRDGDRDLQNTVACVVSVPQCRDIPGCFEDDEATPSPAPQARPGRNPMPADVP